MATHMSSDIDHRRMGMLTGRRALTAAGWGLVGITLASCGGSGAGDKRRAGAGTGARGTPADFEALFAAYQPAPEPDADPSRVVWPEFVLQAGPEVRRLYEFALVNGE